jgi:hypothetical protein
VKVADVHNCESMGQEVKTEANERLEKDTEREASSIVELIENA